MDMNYKTSDQKIDIALKLAFWKITFPSMAFMIGFAGISFFIIKQKTFPLNDSFQIVLAIIFLLVGLIGSWVIWSVRVPIWRIEAYALVDDIAELKKRAVLKMIIWPDGHIFGRTEIASEQIREQIKKIEQSKRRQ